MSKVIPYDTETRDQFDSDTQSILDSIRKKFPIVEIELPVEGKAEQWFVQVYRNGRDGMPEGFYGKTAQEAAQRIAKALKVSV